MAVYHLQYLCFSGKYYNSSQKCVIMVLLNLSMAFNTQGLVAAQNILHA